MTKVICCCMLMVPIKSELFLSLFRNFFYPKPLFPRWAMWLQSNGLFLSRNIQTQVTDGGMGARGEGGWGHRFLEILYPPPTVYFFFLELLIQHPSHMHQMFKVAEAYRGIILFLMTSFSSSHLRRIIFFLINFSGLQKYFFPIFQLLNSTEAASDN